MIDELQKSGAALDRKHIEIATVNEEVAGAAVRAGSRPIWSVALRFQRLHQLNGEGGGISRRAAA